LPQNLETLKFGLLFDEVIEEGALPISLKHLQLGYLFNRPLNNVLHNSLHALICGWKLTEKFIIPNQLRNLTIRQTTFENIQNFPESLEKLYFCGEMTMDNNKIYDYWLNKKLN